MKTIKQTYILNATQNQVFDAFVNPDTIKEWSGAPADIDDKVGTKFSMFGGQIHGTNLEVVANEKLVQEWFSGDWEKPSKVTFSLSENDEGTTIIELSHEGVPDSSYTKIEQGWKEFYLGQIQKMFEK